VPLHRRCLGEATIELKELDDSDLASVWPSENEDDTMVTWQVPTPYAFVIHSATTPLLTHTSLRSHTQAKVNVVPGAPFSYRYVIIAGSETIKESIGTDWTEDLQHWSSRAVGGLSNVHDGAKEEVFSIRHSCITWNTNNADAVVEPAIETVVQAGPSSPKPSPAKAFRLQRQAVLDAKRLKVKEMRESRDVGRDDRIAIRKNRHEEAENQEVEVRDHWEDSIIAQLQGVALPLSLPPSLSLLLSSSLFFSLFSLDASPSLSHTHTRTRTHPPTLLHLSLSFSGDRVGEGQGGGGGYLAPFHSRRTPGSAW